MARRASARQAPTPTTGAPSVRGRAVFVAPRGAYDGARSDLREMKHWFTSLGDAISDSSGDLPALRKNAADLLRNAPVAAGAQQTTVMGVVGTGFKVHPRIDRDLLGLSDEEAKAWEKRASWLWTMWAGSTACDLARRRTFASLTRQFFASAWARGDAFAMRRQKTREGDPFSLRLQFFEADRVGTPSDLTSDARIIDGIEIDDDGAMVAVHVANRHPHARYASEPLKWNRVPVFGRSGERLILQLNGSAGEDRIGALRGIPALATVIKRLKTLDRFSDAELNRQLVASMFVAFIKNHFGTAMAVPGEEPAEPQDSLKNVKMSGGALIGLKQDEEVEFGNPPGPSGNYDPFTTVLLRETGTALNIPYEVLVRHFTASFSASRAAIQLAWRAFEMIAQWVEDDFLQPVYEWFITDCELQGLLDAPGFHDDPLMRRAWCNVEFAGPRPPQINPLQETDAAVARINARISTLQREQADLGYGDYDDNLEQQAREQRDRTANGFDKETVAERIATEPTQPVPANPDNGSDSDLEVPQHA